MYGLVFVSENSHTSTHITHIDYQFSWHTRASLSSIRNHIFNLNNWLKGIGMNATTVVDTVIIQRGIIIEYTRIPPFHHHSHLCIL